jgi:hypothetical protein
LTYTGPFTDGPPTPFKLTTTTYTIVIPTRGPNGVVEPQTYTIIGVPLGDSNSQLPGTTTTVTGILSTLTVTNTRALPAVTVTAQCQVRLFSMFVLYE